MQWQAMYAQYNPIELFSLLVRIWARIRVTPDAELAGYPAAGYPAIFFAGYPESGRISGWIVNIEFNVISYSLLFI